MHLFCKIITEKFGSFIFSPYLCTRNQETTVSPMQRRDGRVVDYSSLENYRTERYRGFESLSLRNVKKKEVRLNFFLFCCIILIRQFFILNRQNYPFSPRLIDKNPKNSALIRQKYPKTLCLFDKNTPKTFAYSTKIPNFASKIILNRKL